MIRTITMALIFMFICVYGGGSSIKNAILNYEKGKYFDFGIEIMLSIMHIFILLSIIAMMGYKIWIS